MACELWGDNGNCLHLKTTLSPEDFHGHERIQKLHQSFYIWDIYNDDFRECLIILALRPLFWPNLHNEIERAKEYGIKLVLGGVKYRMSRLLSTQMSAKCEVLYAFFGQN